MKKTILLLAFLVLSNIIQAQNQQVIEFQIEGLSCGHCANTAEAALENLEGVDSASVDFNSKKAVVYSGNAISKTTIKKVISSKNFEALFADDEPPRPLTEAERAGLDIQTIKGGAKLKFKKHLTEGKITIFDFYADWCGPCRVYSPKLERLLLQYDHVALRKVDVVNWKSEIAKQLTDDYRIPALPFTLIFDDQGKLIGKVEGNDIQLVEQILKDHGI